MASGDFCKYGGIVLRTVVHEEITSVKYPLTHILANIFLNQSQTLIKGLFELLDTSLELPAVVICSFDEGDDVALLA